ncbi:hypothetical protein LWI28_028910 [Acer negundo]|uniref:40S ribosomal protein S18 n=2 Tax=rosids TaxID=71275 RepID=A0AAD5P6I5_ACENE|nr:hypothetical protein LWI28_028910 [Acer negundo]
MGVNGRKYHAENRKIYRLEPKSARLNSQFEVAEASEDGVARWNQRMKLEASVFNGGKVTRVTDVSVNARGFIAAFVAVWSTSMQHWPHASASVDEEPLLCSSPNPASKMSLVANEEFQHILRVLNTNVDGKQKIMFALTSIKGIGRRFANIVCKKADVDMNKRAGELTSTELDNLMVIVANPRQFKIPDWFLNRQKDYKDGKYSQVVSNALDMKLRDDLERLKKIRNHRGLRHYWGLRVRGQHTKTTGRRGKTVGVSKKR